MNNVSCHTRKVKQLGITSNPQINLEILKSVSCFHKFPILAKENPDLENMSLT